MVELKGRGGLSRFPISSAVPRVLAGAWSLPSIQICGCLYHTSNFSPTALASLDSCEYTFHSRQLRARLRNFKRQSNMNNYYGGQSQVTAIGFQLTERQVIMVLRATERLQVCRGLQVWVR